MYHEDLATVDNAAKVAAEGIPSDISMYIVYANPLMEPYVSADQSVGETYSQAQQDNGELDYISLYNQEAREYFAQYDNIMFEEMSGPARLYTYSPAELSKKIIKFIETK